MSTSPANYMAILTALALCCAMSCRSKLDVAVSGNSVATGTTSGAAVDQGPVRNDDQPITPPRGRAIEVADGLTAPREWLQTRTPLVIAIGPALATAGDSVGLFNDTTQRTLIAPSSLAASATLRLEPLAPDTAAGLAYGDNDLRLVVAAGGDSERSARRKVIRRDFTYIAAGTAAGTLRRRAGLELDFSGWRQHVVGSDKTVLVLGTIELLDR